MKLFGESERKENNNEVMEELVNKEISTFNSEGFDNYKKVLNFFNENNIELTDEQDEALYMALTESNTSEKKSFKSIYEECMAHMLKYKYNPSKQTTSWLDSIRKSTIQLNEIYNIGSKRYKIDNLSDEELNKMYKVAVGLAKKDGNNVSKYPKTLPEELTVKNVVNTSVVNDYVNKYKSNELAIRELERRNNDLYSKKE